MPSTARRRKLQAAEPSPLVTGGPVTNAELTALLILQGSGGSMLVSRIPDRTERDCLGSVEPGAAVYRKLEKAGLVLITEEDLIDEHAPELGTWTPAAELTTAGVAALQEAGYGPVRTRASPG